MKKACFEKDEDELRKQMKSKCEGITNDKFGIQEYMKNNDLKTIRELFRLKTRMNHLKANYPGDPKNRMDGLVCVGCGKIKETNSHVAECDTYSDLKIGRDLNTDKDLVDFFRDVMSRREKIVEKSRKAKS